MFEVRMTASEFLEYRRLKEQSPKFSKFDLYTSVTGAGLCFTKALAEQLGLLKIAAVCLTLSHSLIWFLIAISIIKGIEKACNHKTRSAGITQLIGSLISIILMLI